VNDEAMAHWGLLRQKQTNKATEVLISPLPDQEGNKLRLSKV